MSPARYLFANQSHGSLIGAGPSFEAYIHAIRERETLREVAQNRQSEEDELEGLLTWFSIHLEDAETNLGSLQQEVIKKRSERKAVVRDTLCVLIVHSKLLML